MRVTEIAVKGLFGLFDHVIPLNLEDRITIIHGPNGVGKTVLLKMVDALFAGNHELLTEIPFSSFTVFFDDNQKLELTRQPAYRIELTDLNKSIVKGIYPRGNVDYSLSNSSVSGNEPAKKEVLSEPEWLTNLRLMIPTHLIATQRLFGPTANKRNGFHSISQVDALASQPKRESELMVEQCAYRLSEKMQAMLAESAEKSQTLDRSFPTRLLQSTPNPVLSSVTIIEELKQLEKEQARLTAIGLLDGVGIEVSSNLPIDEQSGKVLSIYIHDAKQKLSVFTDLADRLDLLQRIVNQKFLYKKLNISKEKGFVLTSDKNTPIPLEGLSSGEQHELVLLYELLFNTKPGSLILIDEPEISLHVAWQVNFLRDLQDICKLAELDVVLATHSPEIIHDRWDLTVELKGPTK